MKLSAEQLQAKGFYRAPNAQAVGRSAPAPGRTFDAVAKSQSEFEVLEPAAAQSKNRSYSPPVSPVRTGAGLFQAVANMASSVPVVDIYV
ncbi:MAG: hypothetical protein RL497_1288 [Pseudomonadota bacterium]|jgi:hypothetical protein